MTDLDKMLLAHVDKGGDSPFFDKDGETMAKYDEICISMDKSTFKAQFMWQKQVLNTIMVPNVFLTGGDVVHLTSIFGHSPIKHEEG